MPAPAEPPPFQKGSGRLELALAITDPKNPLTARVIVNRIWSNYFGRGLVGTPSNFGSLGDRPTHPELFANLNHPKLDRTRQRRQLDLLAELNRHHQADRPADAALDAQIRAMETAFKMQTEAADAFDIRKEPEPVREMYGDSIFGQSCLLARRLAERGVRFVQVYYLAPKENQPWDSHQDNDNRHRKLCSDSDRATAALLVDLKRRGLLDDTLVIWGGEFGRTPYAEINKEKQDAKPGRDHHHTGFSMLLAGGGIRGGLVHGATDEFGMHAVENRVHVHDLHATILYLLGIDHERLNYRYSGRDFRLTDVHGNVVREILA